MVDPPAKNTNPSVTELLGAVSSGEAGKTSELLPLVYGDLRKLAAARMAQLGPGQTLQATALVNEVYVRLVGTEDPGWQGRAHFLAAAARAMRNILADHLRAKHSLKRGGNFRRVGEETAAGIAFEGPSGDELAVEEALEELELEYPRKAEVVTLTCFGGLAVPEIAEVLDLSTRTVERDWRFAKAWLNRRLADFEAAP